MTADRYDDALGHLHAAMMLVTQCGDTLAAALIAQAIDVVERSGSGGTLPSSLARAANRRPC